MGLGNYSAGEPLLVALPRPQHRSRRPVARRGAGASPGARDAHTSTIMKKLPIALISAAGFCAGPAALAADNMPAGLTVRASGGAEHDDNVLRQGSGQITDNIVIAYVGLKYDQQFSLQRLHAD